jgi:hypothetical protein
MVKEMGRRKQIESKRRIKMAGGRIKKADAR